MLSDSIALYLLKNEYIKDDELPIYKYGLSSFINGLFQILTIIILAIIFHRLAETVIFLTVFVFVRRFLGGYHANTRKKCFLLSVFTWTICVEFNVLFMYINNLLIAMLIVVVSLYVTCRYAPIENINKPLSKYQKDINGKKGRTLVFVLLIVAIVVMKTSSKISATILGTLFMIDIYILAGRGKNVKRKIM